METNKKLSASILSFLNGFALFLGFLAWFTGRSSLPDWFTKRQEYGIHNKSGTKDSVPSLVNGSNQMRPAEQNIFEYVAESENWNNYVRPCAIGLVCGVLALATPCMFPMLPLTVSFITRRSKSRKWSIINAFIYSFSIMLIYSLIAVPFFVIGDVRAGFFQSIWVNIAFFFVVFICGISLLGIFEMNLPTKLSEQADKRSDLDTIPGVFFMAVTLVLVSFSCVGPIISLLIMNLMPFGAAQLVQAVVSFGFTIGFSFLFFVVFPEKFRSIPRSGGWLSTARTVIALGIIILSFKFLYIF